MGDDLAVRIPADLAREHQIQAGDAVEFHILDGDLLMTPASPTYTLDELVAGITDDNLHAETRW